MAAVLDADHGAALERACTLPQHRLEPRNHPLGPRVSEAEHHDRRVSGRPQLRHDLTEVQVEREDHETPMSARNRISPRGVDLLLGQPSRVFHRLTEIGRLEVGVVSQDLLVRRLRERSG